MTGWPNGKCVRDRLPVLCLVASAFASSWLAAGPNDQPRGALAERHTIPSTPPPPCVSDGIANVKAFGATGDGTTDDTDAIRLAIESLADSGGHVYFPAGRYLVSGQIVLPNDGRTEEPQQPAFVFSGAGALFNGRGGAPNGGTILDLRYSEGPKIVTYGLGSLEMSDITFADYGDGPGDFLYTTNTTLNVHHCGFYGSRPNWQAHSDAIVLGGTGAEATVGTNDANAPFQGYGTVIRDNYFNRIRRLVYGRVFANAVVVTGNTAWKNCGTNLPDGAAIELDGDPDDVTLQSNGGWYVAGNLIEMRDYVYGIKCRESQRSAFIGNNFYDPNHLSIAYYRFEETGRLNYVVAGFHVDTLPFVEDAAQGVNRSTVFNFHQSQETLFPQVTRFTGPVYLASEGPADPYGPRVVNGSGTELTYQLVEDAGMSVTYAPESGAATKLWEVRDMQDGRVVHELQGSEAWLRNTSGSVRVEASMGEPVEIGSEEGRGISVRNGEVTFAPSTVRILTGAGLPTTAAPDGSLYLRTDAGTGAALYVREGGAWVPK